ncbi:MAG: dihydroorotate dehydrogenase [Candidatus Diapherotrites archaeon]
MIEVFFAGMHLKNPTVLASGILGLGGKMLCRVALEGGAGAVTMKSIGPTPRNGNNNPTILALDHGLINAVGLPTPGYKNLEEEWSELKQCSVPVIASVFGGSLEEFVEVTENVAQRNPAMIEMNISCPNTKEHGMLFGVEPESAAAVVSAVKNAAGKIPVMAKLTPNTHKFVAVGKACVEAGADALCAINTVGPGMAINIDAEKPVLAFKTGGLSGPAIKPIAVRCVYQLYKEVQVPILGLGGVTYGKDAIEMVMAGATAVGIGTGVYYRGIGVFKEVADEMRQWMEQHGYKSLKDLRGKAHE